MRVLLLAVALVVAYVIPTAPTTHFEPVRFEAVEAKSVDKIDEREPAGLTKVPIKQEPKPAPRPAPRAAPATVSGNKQSWLAASNIPQSQWHIVDWLVTRESGWRPTAQNPTSSAFGLKQFLDSTWATVGCVKSTDPVYQLNCGQKYVMQRYGSWSAAQSFWQANRYY